ncbi:lipid-A-disaccharide synthase [Candidatus Sumerlaeota bacterium]|nr:lipid-A-disaccharide synthase [Candidatus Sumerlaeota bacterium]
MPTGSAPEIFVSAGEASGDLHASNLVRAIQRIEPSARFHGVGGRKLEAAGVELIDNIVDRHAHIGLNAVRSLRKYFRLLRDIEVYLNRVRPDALVMIDSPEFHMRVAPMAKRLGIPVIYYIPPQIWAWRFGRIRKIRRIVDKVLCILPFEEKIYRDSGIDVTYVGHPILDIMRLTMTRDEVFDHFGFDPDRRLIGILPGSRGQEIDRLLPTMIAAAELIAHEIPDVQFVLPRAMTVSAERVDWHLSQSRLPIRVVDEYRYNVRSAMDFCLCKSGTSTLETAFLGCPMVVVYRVDHLSWFIGKSLVKVPFVGLVNVVGGEQVVPECIQQEATPRHIAEAALRILTDPELYENIRFQLQKIRARCGGPGASARAAAEVLRVAQGSLAEVEIA